MMLIALVTLAHSYFSSKLYQASFGSQMWIVCVLLRDRMGFCCSSFFFFCWLSSYFIIFLSLICAAFLIVQASSEVLANSIFNYKSYFLQSAYFSQAGQCWGIISTSISCSHIRQRIFSLLPFSTSFNLLLSINLASPSSLLLRMATLCCGSFMASQLKNSQAISTFMTICSLLFILNLLFALTFVIDSIF